MKVTKSMFPITYYRSNIILHVNICEEKAVKCKVEGCGRIIKRREINQHIAEAATSHYRLQLGGNTTFAPTYSCKGKNKSIFDFHCIRFSKKYMNKSYISHTF